MLVHVPAVVGAVLGVAVGNLFLGPDCRRGGLRAGGDGVGLGLDLPGLLLDEVGVGAEGEDGGIEGGVGHGLMVGIDWLVASLVVGCLFVTKDESECSDAADRRWLKSSKRQRAKNRKKK